MRGVDGDAQVSPALVERELVDGRARESTRRYVRRAAGTADVEAVYVRPVVLAPRLPPPPVALGDVERAGVGVDHVALADQRAARGGQLGMIEIERRDRQEPEVNRRVSHLELRAIVRHFDGLAAGQLPLHG